MHDEYAIDQLCATLAVTRSGYHAWAGRLPGPRAQANTALLPPIAQAHRESRQTYGSPRVQHWLQQHGQPCGRHRVARLMRSVGLRRQSRRRFRPLSLTDSNHDLPIAPNRLRDLATTTRRDAVWVADTLSTTLPLAALDMALQQRRPPVVHHSDRGCQYASAAYRQKLVHAVVIPSRSRPGIPTRYCCATRSKQQVDCPAC